MNNNEIFAELRSIVDTLIDGDTKRMGEDINKVQRPNEIWIFDSRMAFDNIPDVVRFILQKINKCAKIPI